MIPPIGRLVSSSFYDGALEHGRAATEIPLAALPSDLDKALVWVETDSLGVQGFQQSEQNGTSLTNPAEADLIMTLMKLWADCDDFCEWLETQTAHTRPIGIICTYAAQRDLLRKKLQIASLSVQFKSSIMIDTVDSYQGKENPIVVLSLVRNNANGPQDYGVATIKDGFLSRPNRINVAMSRAMDRLVIVGAKGRWHPGGPMARVVDAFDREMANNEARLVEGAQLLHPIVTSDMTPHQKDTVSVPRDAQ
jgi:superfamily I DNA and/or RNA helicase